MVASFSPGHGRPEHAGHATIVDPGNGPDDRNGARQVSRGAPNWRDPYPLSEEFFLVVEGRRLLVMDGRGRTEVLYELPESAGGAFCHEPRPLAPRQRERAIAPRIDLRKSTGRLILTDLYEGRNMAGVSRGEIKKLLVLEQLPKPVNFSGGPWPLSNGGTFTLARILGTVPVEPDGSADVEVPALRSLFFVALDENGLAVKRMQSFVTVQPGEITGCVGCHETRVTTPLSNTRQLAALRRPPKQIAPFDGIPGILDLPRNVQPILDRHCVTCHNPDKFTANVDLTGDHTPLFSQSYWTIIQRGLIADGRNEAGNRAPRAIGSTASRLLTKFDGTHNGEKPTAREVATVRLWIDAGAPYAGTYAALGSGMFPVKFPVKAMTRRCASCHGHKPKGKPIAGQTTYFRFGKEGPPEPLVHTLMHLRDVRAGLGYYKFGWARSTQSLCNLTRPEKSLVLRAPLAKAAGGHGLCEGQVFATTDDADYQAILGAIREASARMAEEKRFDMPGFRPNGYYLHQRQRYEVLSAELPEGPIDPYATDEAYCRRFWYSEPS